MDPVRVMLLLAAALLWAIALAWVLRAYGRLQAQLAAVPRRLADAEAELLRRARRDRETAEVARTREVLLELLPALDNLDRALQVAGDAASPWLEGVRLTRRSFLEALARCGAQPVPALGQPFDPRVHEAVATVESAEQPPGQVVAVLREGFTLGDKLLRPALCQVSRAPAPAPTPAPPNAAEPPMDAGQSG